MPMMRTLALAASPVLPVAAQAQTPLPTFSVSAQVTTCCIIYLANSGTPVEGTALAEQLTALAQQQINAAQKPAEPKAP